jgi:hypothetical protein
MIEVPRGGLEKPAPGRAENSFHLDYSQVASSRRDSKSASGARKRAAQHAADTADDSRGDS